MRTNQCGRVKCLVVQLKASIACADWSCLKIYIDKTRAECVKEDGLLVSAVNVGACAVHDSDEFLAAVIVGIASIQLNVDEVEVNGLAGRHAYGSLTAVVNLVIRIIRTLDDATI